MRTNTLPHQGPQLIAVLSATDIDAFTVEARSTKSAASLAYAIRQTLRTFSLGPDGLHDATVTDLGPGKVHIRFEDPSTIQADYLTVHALLWQIATRFSRVNDIPIETIELVTVDRE